MAKSTQESLGKIDFNYPLNCLFEIHGMNPDTKTYSILYNRKVLLEMVLIYISIKLCWQRQRHRLYVTTEDNMKIKYKFISSIRLNKNPGGRIRL